MSGCGSDGPTRSVASFCSTYNTQKAKFEQKYSALESGAAPTSGTTILMNLVAGFQSLGDAVIIFDKLDAVAPSDIEPDVATVRDSLKNMESTMGDEASNAFNPTGMFGAVLKGILSSVETSGSWTRVGDYVEQNCTSGE